MDLPVYLLGMINLMTGLVAVLAVAVGIRIGGSTECERYAQWRVAVMGAVVLAISVVGMVAAWHKRAWRLIYVYVGVVLLVELLLLAISIATIILLSTQATVGIEQLLPEDTMMSSAVYSFSSFSSSSSSSSSPSNWLQTQVLHPHTWALVKSCISTYHICHHTTAIANDLSPIQSGCCLHPRACKLIGQQAHALTHNATIEDCLIWNDDELCLDCNSCKGGVLETLKKSRRKAAIVSSMILLYLIGVLLIGCCALKSTRKKKKGSKFFPKTNARNSKGVHPSEEG